MKVSLSLVAAAAALSAGLAEPAFAGPVTLGFEGTPQIMGLPGFTGPVTESGFTYSKFSGLLFIGDGGNPGNDVQSGIDDLNLTGGGILEVVSATPGQTFNYLGVDAGAGTENGRSLTISVEGLLGGVGVATDSYTFAGNFNFTTENALNLAGKTVDELLIDLPANVTLFGGDDGSNIDNLRLSTADVVAAPEPASIAIFGAGLAALGWMRRKRKAS